MRALGAAQEAYAARGVTAVYEGHGIAPEVLAVYREARERGALRVRATLAVSPTWDGPVEAAPGCGMWRRGRAAAGSATIACAWPASACTTAATRASRGILHDAQPYTGWAGFVESANTREAYARQATLAARLRVRVNTLVTRCLPEVLDVWEAVAARHPIRDRRWVLVHLNAATPAQLTRIRRLGVVATTNPISYLYRSAGDEVAHLGGAADQLLPHRSLARHRIPFGIATDNKPADPWVAFAAVVARRDMRTGIVVGPEERHARAGAVRAHRRRRRGDVRRARAWAPDAGLGRRSRRAGARPADGATRDVGRPDGSADDGRRRDRASRLICARSPGCCFSSTP